MAGRRLAGFSQRASAFIRRLTRKAPALEELLQFLCIKVPKGTAVKVAGSWSLRPPTKQRTKRQSKDGRRVGAFCLSLQRRRLFRNGVSPPASPPEFRPQLSDCIAWARSWCVCLPGRTSGECCNRVCNGDSRRKQRDSLSRQPPPWLQNAPWQSLLFFKLLRLSPELSVEVQGFLHCHPRPL